MAEKSISIRIDLQEKEYQTKIKALRKEMEVFRSELTLVESEFVGQQNSLDAITAKTEVYKRQVQNLTEQLKAEEKANNILKSDLETVRGRIEELTRIQRGQKNTIDVLNGTIEKYSKKQEEIIFQTAEEARKYYEAQEALHKLNKEFQGPDRDTEEYKRRHKELSDTMKEAAIRSGELEKQYKHNETVLKRSVTSVETFNRKINEEQTELNELAVQEQKIVNAINKHETNQNKLNAGINTTNNTLARLSEAERDAANSINGTTDAIDKNTGAFVDNEDEIDNIANSLAVELAEKGFNVVKEAVTKSIDAFREYDVALKGVSKTTGLSGAELNELGEKFQYLSTQMPFSAAELLNVAQVAGQLGVKGAENLEKFTETMAMLSVSTSLSAEEAGTALAQVAAVTGMTSDKYDRLGSSIVALGNNFATTENDIIRIAQRFSGAAVSAELSESAIVAMAAASSAVGLQAESAGTSLTKLVQKMQDAVESGDDLENWAKIAGVSGDKFKRIWGEDATKAIAMFLDGIGSIEGSTGPAFKSIGIGEARLKDLVTRLGNAEHSTQLFSAAVRVSNEAFEQNNALTNEAGIFFESLDSKITDFNDSVNVLAIRVGEQLAPQLEAIINGAGDVVDTFSAIIDVAPWVVQALEAITIVLGTMAVIALPKAFTSIGNFVSGLTAMKEAMSAQWAIMAADISSAIGTIGTSALIAAGYVGLIAAALAILIPLVNKYGHEGDVATKKTKEATEAYETKAEATAALAEEQEKLNYLIDLAAKEEEECGEVSADTSEALDNQTAVVNSLKDALDDIPEAIPEVVESQGKLEKAIQEVTEEIDKQTEAFKKNLQNVSDFSTEYEKSATDYMEALKQQIEWNEKYTENRENLWNRDINGLKDYVSSIDDGTASAAEQMNALANASDDVLEEIVRLYNESKQANAENVASYEETVEEYRSASAIMEERVNEFVRNNSEAYDRMAKHAKVKIQEIQSAINGIKGKSVEIIIHQSGSPLDGSMYYMANAQGLEYVPYDGFLSELHEGEMVLNRAEASAYRALENSVTNNNNTNNNIVLNVYSAKGQTADEIANVVMTKIQQATDRRVAVWA